MAPPWVILGRVLRAGPGLDAVDAGAEHAAAMEAEEGAQAEEHVAAMDVDVDAEPQAQAENAAAEPDFTVPVELPPRVAVLAAGRGAHPDADKPDKYPYIIAAGRFCLLAHFAVAPSHGTCFDHDPQNTHLVLVRFGHTADGGTMALAEHVPRRTRFVPALWNVGSVGLLSDNERLTIAELRVHQGSDRATLVSFESKLAAFHPSGWSSTDVACPLPAEDRDREWVPHGTVSISGSSICWFDLSWGMLICDHVQTRPSFNFHRLPGGRALAKATPDIHNRRCITVTMEIKRCNAVNKLRYVEIIAPEGKAATVTMWTRIIGDRGRWEWEMNYEVSFESIWNDDSYKETSLPPIVPVLAVVSPSNHEVVYFALEQHLFGVNVPRCRVVHRAAYDPVNIQGRPPQPASGRYLVPWNPSQSVAHALGIDPIVGGGGAAAQDAALQAALIDNEEEPAGEMEYEEQPVAEIDFDDQPAAEIDHAKPHAAVVYDGVQIEEINRIIDIGMFAPDKFSSDEETLEPGMGLTMQMDQGTLNRLKAEIQEEFAKDQDSGDDGGQGSL